MARSIAVATSTLLITFALGCSGPDYLVGMENDVAFLEENLIPIGSVEGPLYYWGVAEDGLQRADSPPRPEGGMQSILSSFRYPVGARRRCATGDVMVRFVVDERGTVIAAAPLEPVDPDLDVAATVVIARARFEAGMKDGQPAKVITRMPISYNLTGRC